MKSNQRRWPYRAMLIGLVVGTLGVSACRRPAGRAGGPAGSERLADDGGSLDTEAREYVTLALQLARLNPDAVETYIGPADRRRRVDAAPMSLFQVVEATEALRDELRRPPAGRSDASSARRRQVLRAQVEALAIQARMAAGGRLPFDEEARALFGIAPSAVSRAAERDARRELDRLLPGRGALADRYVAFQKRLLVPRDRLPAVLAAALAACRQRTLAHVALPPGERFTVQYVTGKPWNAYNRYRGGYQSVIQVNTDLPVSVDRVLDLACHEGYPGHHLFNVLREQRLVRGLEWPEFSIATLMSPQGLIEEGASSDATNVAFPGDERLAFEKAVLFPLAGLDAAQAARGEQIRRLTERLAAVTTDVARDYLDGAIDARAAEEALAVHAAMPDPAVTLAFIERYRSYVIAYTTGRDLVRGFIDAHGGTADHPERRWDVFLSLAATPRLPRELEAPVR